MYCRVNLVIVKSESFHFSTLYTAIPHQKVISRLATIIRNSFIHKNGNRRYKGTATPMAHIDPVFNLHVWRISGKFCIIRGIRPWARRGFVFHLRPNLWLILFDRYIDKFWRNINFKFVRGRIFEILAFEIHQMAGIWYLSYILYFQ